MLKKILSTTHTHISTFPKISAKIFKKHLKIFLRLRYLTFTLNKNFLKFHSKFEPNSFKISAKITQIILNLFEFPKMLKKFWKTIVSEIMEMFYNHLLRILKIF